MCAKGVKRAVTYDWVVEQGSTVSDGRSGGDHDPDAPWRPGFDGWSAPDDDAPGDGADERGLRGRADAASERWSRANDERVPEPWVPVRPVRPAPEPALPDGPPVAVVDGQPNSAVTGELFLTGMGVLVALIVAGVATLLLPVGSTAEAVVTAPTVPAAADVAWTTEVRGVVDDIAVGGDVVVVTTAEGVHGLRQDDGTVSWERLFDGTVPVVDRVAIVDGHFVMQQRAPGGRSVVRVLDAASGADVWDSLDLDGSLTVAGPPERPVLVRRTRVDDSTMLELVDAATGAALGDPVRLSAVTAAGDHFAVQPSDRRVAAWSVGEREVVAGPVDSFNLRTVAPLRGAIVALDLEGRIVAFDERGRRADEQPFVSDAPGEFTGRAELASLA